MIDTWNAPRGRLTQQLYRTRGQGEHMQRCALLDTHQPTKIRCAYIKKCFGRQWASAGLSVVCGDRVRRGVSRKELPVYLLGLYLYRGVGSKPLSRVRCCLHRSMRSVSTTVSALAAPWLFRCSCSYELGKNSCNRRLSRQAQE